MKLKVFGSAAVVVGLVCALAGCASTGGMPSFGAEIGAKPNPLGGSLRLPYTKTVSYFGYVKPGAPADATVDGKKMYYLYVWIPIVAPEIGIRMISPAPKGLAPKAGDFVSPSWEAGKADSSNYFDTWISWERSAEVLSEKDIVAKGKSGSWLKFDSNDDSSEMPAQPSGSKYNSLLRIVSDTGNPLKSLVRGLYRIGFTTYKVGEVKGSFLAQVGAPIDIPGVVVGSSLEEVMAKASGASK
jgi:hypothetical protein